VGVNGCEKIWKISPGPPAKIEVPLTTMNRLANNLRASDSESASYWPTAAELISYRSVLTSKWSDEKLTWKNGANMPRCTDSPPLPAKVVAVPSPTSFTAQSATYSNCKVTLDDPVDVSRINDQLKSEYPFLNFKNCLVEYRGGEIKFPFYRDSDNGKLISAFWFEDSVFNFSVNSTLSSSGKELLRALLTQTSGTIRFPDGAQPKAQFVMPWKK